MNLDRSSLVVAAMGIGIAAILWIGARSIAPPLFDPVGSAALPRACAVALVGLGLGTLAQSLLSRRPVPEAGATIRPATFGTAALMVAYLAAMQFGVSFLIATVFFVAVAVPLVGGARRLIPIGTVLALALGFASVWLFTSVFFIDLPGT